MLEKSWIRILVTAALIAPAGACDTRSKNGDGGRTGTGANTGATASEGETVPMKESKPETEGPGEAGTAPDPALLDPSKADEEAPEVYKAKFETSKGDFVIEVHRSWSPHGADRFYNAVKAGFYDGVRFFRVVDGFVAQFGINGDPEVSAAWRDATIPDDPVVMSNERGFVSFAKRGPDSRTTQVFINYRDNSGLDGMGFPAFGHVVEGMEVVDSLYAGYGDGPPRGQGPNQGLIQSRGNEYLNQSFPRLDYVKRATIIE